MQLRSMETIGGVVASALNDDSFTGFDYSGSGLGKWKLVITSVVIIG